MRITFGCAVHDDFYGLHPTIQSARMQLHALLPPDEFECVVVDNNPHSPHGKLTAEWCASQAPRVRYVAYTEHAGTSAPRDEIFRQARGDIVLVTDPHVILSGDSLPTPSRPSRPFGIRGALRTLLDFYEQHPESQDLIQGPLLYDHMQPVTHFNNDWGTDAMWGRWALAWRCRCNKFLFSPTDRPDNRMAYQSLAMPMPDLLSCPVCQNPFPTDVGWAGHEDQLFSRGYRLAISPLSDQEPHLPPPPFEIPAMGFGLFACRRDAWLWFDPEFLLTGFGGEEHDMHEAFRQAGRKTLCLPGLLWNHRFPRIDRTYALSTQDKCHNYVRWAERLGLPLEPIRAAFVENTGATKLSQKTFDQIVRTKIKAPTPPPVPVSGVRSARAPSGRIQPPPGMTLEGLFELFRDNPAYQRDFHDQFNKVRELCTGAGHVTVVTKRREICLPVIAARPLNVVVYQTERDELVDYLHALVSNQKPLPLETLTVHEIDYDLLKNRQLALTAQTDVLLIDSLHDADQIKSELDRWAPMVNPGGLILLRSAQAFGENSEFGTVGRGLIAGMREWQKEHPEWRRIYHSPISYGLSVYTSDPLPRSIDDGPGTELSAILDTLGITERVGCDCKTKMAQMNTWGVEGCREHVAEIVGWMQAGQTRWGWSERLMAAGKAVTTGLAFNVNWLDPFPSLIEHAIQIAERKEHERLARLSPT